MSELRIPLDPFNPGQFFACCGLFELVTKFAPGTCASFVVEETRPRRAQFVVDGGGLPKLEILLEALRRSEFELIEEGEQATWPVRLSVAGQTLVLDWWLDTFREKPSSLKCWAGQVTTRKLFEDLRPLVVSHGEAATLMTAAAMSKSKFGVDPRSAWNALDFGFSPDVHQKDAATYPCVEMLAAIGLQGFRPNMERREGMFHLWTISLPLAVARMAAVAAWDGLPRFDYKFKIAKRGQSYKYFALAEFVQRKV